MSQETPKSEKSEKKFNECVLLFDNYFCLYLFVSNIVGKEITMTLYKFPRKFLKQNIEDSLFKILKEHMKDPNYYKYVGIESSNDTMQYLKNLAKKIGFSKNQICFYKFALLKGWEKMCQLSFDKSELTTIEHEMLLYLFNQFNNFINEKEKEKKIKQEIFLNKKLFTTFRFARILKNQADKNIYKKLILDLVFIYLLN